MGNMIDLTEEERQAIQWATEALQKTDIEFYGGYYGPAYKYGDVVFIVDPGHESQKYAWLYGFKIKDVIALHKQCVKILDKDDKEEFLENNLDTYVLEGLEKL